MEGIELGIYYGYSAQAGPSRTAHPAREAGNDDDGDVDPRLTQKENDAEAKRRVRAEKKQRKIERAQKRALREAREARTALVDHEGDGIEDTAVEERSSKRKKRQDDTTGSLTEDVVKAKKGKSGVSKARPSAPPQPSSDPENDPFTSSPVKLPPSSPPHGSMEINREPKSPVLLMKNGGKRTRKVKHREDEETPAKLLFPGDESLANGSSSKEKGGAEHPLAAVQKKQIKPTKVKPRSESAQPVQPVSAPHASGSYLVSGKTRKKSGRKPNKETDEDLRKAFTKTSAMNEWLASKWVNLGELKRLEESGVLSYRKGKFSGTEKAAIREHLATFKHMNRLDHQELLEVIHAKGRLSERKEFPKFWPECAAVVPGRPVKYVKDHVKREYDPLARKGPWTSREDETLRRAQETHPNQWAKISQIVERPELDCRCRWRDELQHRDTKAEGHWDPNEQARLVKIVIELNTALGQEIYGSEAPWDLVVEKMGGSRSRTQCRKQWQDKLRYTASGQRPASQKLATPKVNSTKTKQKAADPDPNVKVKAVAKAKDKSKAKKAPASPAKPLVSRIKSKEMIESEDEA